MDTNRFIEEIKDYYRANKRDMPWRRTTDPYRIIVSEIMLQQTQVPRVIPKYREFLKRFPTFAALDRANVSDVLAAWQGLGYNRRALFLKKMAGVVKTDFHGKIPHDHEKLVTLPGIGPNTAAAVCAYAWNMPVPFIETNIRRVYIHFFFPRKESVSDKDIFPLVEKTIDRKNPREWFWALMDYGTMLTATVKNPNRRSASYKKQSRFHGSDREVRGLVVRLLVASERPVTLKTIFAGTDKPRDAVERIIAQLEREGFVRKAKGGYEIQSERKKSENP